MYTELDLYNQALRHLGSKAVADVDEDSKEGRLCRTFFNLSRDLALRRYRWRFALVRAELAQDTVDPEFQWANAFHIPSDPWCLRVLQMERKDYEFAVEGRLLLTNQTSAKILYIKRVVDLGELDPFAADVIAHTLAIKMAVALRGADGVTIKTNLREELEKEILPEARSANSFEGLEPDWNKENAGEWVEARFTGRTNLTLVRPTNL